MSYRNSINKHLKDIIKKTKTKREKLNNINSLDKKKYTKIKKQIFNIKKNINNVGLTGNNFNKIVIIGLGPIGLFLTNLLLKNNISNLVLY